MKREIKIVILVVLALALVGIYLSRNIIGNGNKQGAQSGQNIQISMDLPTMIEFKTDT